MEKTIRFRALRRDPRHDPIVPTPNRRRASTRGTPYRLAQRVRCRGRIRGPRCHVGVDLITANAHHMRRRFQDTSVHFFGRLSIFLKFIPTRDERGTERAGAAQAHAGADTERTRLIIRAANLTRALDIFLTAM